MGSLEPLRGYQGEDIEIQLPGNLTVYDIDWLAVWCVEYRHNFGHVYMPKDLDVPPALGQTKISVSRTSPVYSLKQNEHLLYTLFTIFIKPPWWYNPVSNLANTCITNQIIENIDIYGYYYAIPRRLQPRTSRRATIAVIC